MTFKQAKTKLKNMTQKQFDKYCKLLADLHFQIKKSNKQLANAIELAAMSMMLYIESGK